MQLAGRNEDPGLPVLVIMRERIAILLGFCWAFVPTAKGQVANNDTAYYKSFSGSVIPRVFLSRNYSELTFDGPGKTPAIKYHANTPLNFGIGASYKFVTFSVSKGLGFLQSNSRKGDTKSFDLQAHIYRKKWTVDALAQFYQGYYAAQRAWDSGPGYYLRPDMRLRMVGISVNRVLNDKRFSYGSVLGQGGYQQRSAGSFLLGGNAFYSAINADSALVPFRGDSLYSQVDIRKEHLFLVGAGVGYAYTAVFQKHYFLLGSANVNLNLNFSQEIGSGIRSNNVGITHNFIFRAGAGYNSYKWGLSLLWYTGGISAYGHYSGYTYHQQVGSYKLIYVWRFAVDRKMRRVLNEGY
jgi:hypothetical protein